MTSVWAADVGHLTGYGEFRYTFQPNYVCPHIVVAGCGTVETSIGTWDVQAGEMFCLWPGVAFDYYEHADRPWQFYWIHLTGAGAQAMAEAMGFSPERLVIRPTHPERVVAAYQALYTHYAHPDPSAVFSALALLFQVADACQGTASMQHPGPPARHLVDEAELLMTSLLHTGINVSQLARALRVSRNTLFRAFRDARGVTPCARLQQMRVQRACALLQEREQKLATIARAVGYGGEKYFMRCFRKATGLTPGQWRARHQSVSPTSALP